MKVRSGLAFLIMLSITVLTISGLLGAAWLYLRFMPELADQKLQAEVLRLHAAAMVYRGRMSNFEGVCHDIGVRKPYQCNESTVTFAIAVERADGTYYCTDSSGQVKVVALPIRDRVVCK